MQSKASTVAAYLKSLPAERRSIVARVREVVLKNLPKGYVESMGYGMIVYTIPLSRYPETYNGQPLCYGGLASQKNYVSLYLMSIYVGNEDWFRREFAKAGKRLDTGKGCVRFRRVEDLALDVIGRAVALYTPEKFIECFEKARSASRSKRVAKRKGTRGR